MPILGIQARPIVGRTVLAVSVGLLTAAAWLALWSSETAGHGLFHHHQLSGLGKPSAALMLLFVGGWTLMTVAMMLPTSFPILTTFHTIAGGREDRSVLVTLVIIGYLGAWALFGVVVYLANLALQWLLMLGSWSWNDSWGAPALLLLAGAFQFSSLKYRCLDKCRSPLSFVIEHWQGRHDRWHAFRLGLDHGIFCVGCCWALMLLMFAVGVGSLGWMLILAVVMAIEKNVPWGRRLSAPLGFALIVWGTALLALSP